MFEVLVSKVDVPVDQFNFFGEVHQLKFVGLLSQLFHRQLDVSRLQHLLGQPRVQLGLGMRSQQLGPGTVILVDVQRLLGFAPSALLVAKHRFGSPHGLGRGVHGRLHGILPCRFGD